MSARARSSAVVAGVTETLTPVRSSTLQRACACGQHTHGGGQCAECRKKAHHAEASAAADIPQIALDALKTGGHPLDTGTRTFMESRFGTDFSQVRVHTDGTAAAAARSVGALAYTSGQQIVFGAGRYSPSTTTGKRLLAHELTHVVQQRKGAAPVPQAASAVSQPTDASEHEAVATADQILGGQAPAVTHAPSAFVQRDLADVGKAIGIGLGVAGGLGLVGVGIAALAGAFRSTRWKIAQTNTDGANYSSDVNITFDPDSNMHCDEIAFVQSVKFSDAATHASVETIPNYVQRRTGAGWTLDRIDQRQYGWYGYNNNGRPGGNVSPGRAPSPRTPATLHDTPSDTRPNSVFEFETCAICRAGTDVNKIYSCYHWGFNVDAANHLTSRPTTEAAGPSAEFSESVKQWNVQAAGPAATRNDPSQQALGPFK